MPARFEFKLEPVLRQRQMIEDERQRDLAKVLREKHIIENQLRRAQDDIRADKQTITTALIGHVDVQRIRTHGAAVARAGFQAQQLAVKLVHVHRQIEHARAELLEATKGRKAVELLKQRQYERWKLEQTQREQRLNDELGTQAYIRQSREDAA